jgi:hypothetical protein
MNAKIQIFHQKVTDAKNKVFQDVPELLTNILMCDLPCFDQVLR